MIFLISPKEDMIERIIRIISEENTCGLDFSDYLVVFPGKRPSYYLRKKLASRIGRGNIPPKILSMDGFIDFLFEKIADTYRNIDPLNSVAIIYEILISSQDNNLVSSDRMRKFEYFYPFGLRLFKNFEELYIEKISHERLSIIDSLINIPSKSTETVRGFSSIYVRFYEMLKSRMLSTRSFRYRYVSERFDPSILKNFKKIIFAGLFAFTQSEKDLIKKIYSMNNAIFLFHDAEGIRERISQIGMELNDICRLDPQNDNSKKIHEYPTIKIYSSPDIHGEVFAVGTILKDKKEIDENTVVVLPDPETLFPLIRQGISHISPENYNISMGYPLHRTPIYGFLLLLFQVIGSSDGEFLYAPDYLRFMLHPYMKNIMFRGSAETTRIIIHAFEEYLKTQRRKFLITLYEIEDVISSEVFEKMKMSESIFSLDDMRSHLKGIHDNTIRKFLSISDLGDFTKKCIELLTYIYDYSTARFHPLFFPFYECFIKELKRISASPIKNMSFDQISSYFTFLRRYIASSRVPFDGTPLKGLQILGFLETRNIKFKRVFFLDLNEGIFPESNEDFLLPAGLRRALGLPLPEDKESLLGYYFDVLLMGAEEVYLFYVKDEKKEKSRFIEQLLWRMQKMGIEGDLSEEPVTYRINLEASRPKEIEKNDEVTEFLKSITFSPSMLDVYLKCPLKFYYTYVLALAERRGLEEKVERKEIGSIVHRALFKYFEPIKGRKLTNSDLNPDKMESIVKEIFCERFGDQILGGSYLLMQQVIKRMRQVIDIYYRKMIANQDVEILGLEQTIQQEFDSFHFECRLDRIERRSGLIYIIDYKTGSNERNYRIRFDKMDQREKWADAIGSMQIPLYIILYAKQRGEKINRLRGLYILLGKTSVEGNIEVSPFSDNYEEEILRVETAVKTLLSEIVDPDMPFFACNDIKNNCPVCIYNNLCGTQWVRRRYS